MRPEGTECEKPMGRNCVAEKHGDGRWQHRELKVRQFPAKVLIPDSRWKG